MSAVDIKDTTHRFADVASEPCVDLAPIVGFNRMELVPLKQAIQPLLQIVPGIDTYAHVAKERSKNPADDLTIDESASIMLYTMEWEPYNETVFYILNNTLRLEDRRKLRPWFSYLKLILTALSRLPSESIILYRGVKSDIDSHGDKYGIGKEVFWWGFSSCSKSRDVSEKEQFLGDTGARTLFIIDCMKGKDVHNHSYYKSEQEVLLLPATKLEVCKNENRGNGLHVITLKEIQSTHVFLEQVSTEAEIKTLREQSTAPRPSLLSTVFTRHPSNPPDSERYLNRKLSDHIHTCQLQTEVYINGQCFNEKDVKIIAEQVILQRQCRELSLRETSLTCNGVLILAKALHDNQNLKGLILSHNRIGDQGVQALAQALQRRNNTTLKQLSLGYNEITDTGVNYLVEMLETNRTLTHLNLPKNQITDRGLKALVHVLTHSNQTLQVLSLEWNKFRDEASVDHLVNLLTTNKTLTLLNISSCKLSGKAVKQLKALAKSKTNFQLKIE